MSLISIKDLKFSYDDKSIIDIEELNIDRGERLFIYGPSGCGKSTLLSLLTGVLTPRSGEISINETNLKHLNETKRDRFRGENIGYIFQNFNLLPYLNVIENVLLPLRMNKSITSSSKDEAQALLADLGLRNYLEQNVSNLSYGQQQRVAAARAFMGDKCLIIADEPTSALDEKNCQQFMDSLFLEQEKKNATLIIVSHDLRLKEMFKRQIYLPDINRAVL